MDAATTRASTMGNADLDLVERHRYGDPEAFEEVYARYGAMVFNLALRLTGEAEEAADVSQDVFLKVYRHLAGFRGRSSLRTWVYRVAMNCCRSRCRRGRWWRTRIEPESERRLERLPDRGLSPEQRAMAVDAGEIVAAALIQLPRLFREAVVLRDIEGLSYEEISKVLGVRLGTVRSRIARGRDRLRALLEESK